MSIIEIKNLTKYYKKHIVLDKINLTINNPGIYALVGPNGTGKTTFLNTITNIISASSGSIKILNKCNKDYSIFKEVSYLQDNSILFDYLNGYDHLKYICDVHKIEKKRIQEVTTYVGMENYLKKTVRNYSLGMKQHLLLAMSIINNPRLLLLDEPLNGLDPTSAILIRKILLELAGKGTTIILSSHNLAEIDRITKQILFMKNGSIIWEDMSIHEKTFYHITTSDPELAWKVLIDERYKLERNDRHIKLELNNQSIQPVFTLLNDNKVDILDIQKEIAGSEKRYEKLFEV
ncbi:ABC transporter ATP-binding protein [Bacillus sp. B-jedd]|uniref:ABC transporter ATP-binding protein n=1 Tax=Bacillus sp. B-jedd TaxID=1476857 RepID=UPI0005156D1B|nr:ABC transporter ATP-binding protein [Bacillus sp. B-jedd]CEG26219.1 ABC transporter ATP-binding protein [Bacillus sp. B-jedd]